MTSGGDNKLPPLVSETPGEFDVFDAAEPTPVEPPPHLGPDRPTRDLVEHQAAVEVADLRMALAELERVRALLAATEEERDDFHSKIEKLVREKAELAAEKEKLSERAGMLAAEVARLRKKLAELEQESSKL